MAGVKAAFIYARTSTETQVERGQGLDVQLKLCRDYCRKHRLEVRGEFVDEGVSGASIDRDGLQAMLSNLNGVDYIVVSNTSRLWRDIYPQALILKAMRDAKKDIRAVDEPSFTVYMEDDPNQFLVSGIMGVLDAWERLVITRRLKRGRRSKASKGQKSAGSAPFGYRWAEVRTDGKREKVIEIEPKEAEVVKTMFNTYLRRQSVGKLLKDLKNEGITNRRGKLFSWQALYNILTNTFYIGVVKHGDVEVRGMHEPIVSRVIFGKVQAALDRNRRR